MQNAVVSAETSLPRKGGSLGLEKNLKKSRIVPEKNQDPYFCKQKLLF